MKLIPKSFDEEIEIDMSPMIDMVFLLLIFFIVASQIIDEKPKVAIPKAAYAKVPKDTTGRLMISVRKDDQLFIGQMPTTIEDLGDLLAYEVEHDPNLRILIRSGSEVKYKTNEKIMLICAEVGASDLIYAALEE